MNRILVLDDSQAKLLGWKSKLQQVRNSFHFYIKNNIALGLGLKKGCKIISYLAQDQDGNYVIVSYPSKAGK